MSMGETHLVSGLKALRAEKLDDLERIREDIALLEKKAVEIEGVLVHVDGVLAHVAPDLALQAVVPVRHRTAPSKANGRDHQPAAPRRRHTRPADDKDTVDRNRRGDGLSHELPVTQHVLRLLRTEGIPMTVDEVVEVLAMQRHGAKREKLTGSVRNFLSTKTREGLLSAEAGADGLKRYAVRR